MLRVNNLTKKYSKLLANDDTSKAFEAVIGILNIYNKKNNFNFFCDIF